MSPLRSGLFSFQASEARRHRVAEKIENNFKFVFPEHFRAPLTVAPSSARILPACP